MRERPLEVPDDMKDASKWARCQCPTCGQTAESRWTGLRSVAATGDENAASKQWRPPVFTCGNDGPFIVREEACLPGDRTRFVAIDPSTGITPGTCEFAEQAIADRIALNAAYWLGRSHESHIAGHLIQAARDVHASRKDDVCGDAPHCVHIDTNTAIALADAIEWYDTGVKP